MKYIVKKSSSYHFGYCYCDKCDKCSTQCSDRCGSYRYSCSAVST